MTLSPREAAFVARLQRRAGALSPDMARELLDAYAAIRESLTTAEIEAAISSGQLDAIVDEALLDRSLIPFRAKLQAAVERGFNASRIDLPKAGKIDGQIAVAFDKLSPEIIDAIRALDSRVMNTIKDDIRETVRAHVENGLRDGVAPRTMAREIKAYVGLSPNQLEAVSNYERALRGEGRNPLDYKLRDRRYDALLKRGESLSPEQIDRAVETYRRKMENFHANTVARTAAVDSQKLGQQLSWSDAVEQGIVDGQKLYKRWVTVHDDRVRPEHVAMDGEEVPWDATYSNGENIPGSSTYNCRCVSVFFVKRDAAVAA